MAKKNFISLLVEESKSYVGIERIDQLIQSGQTLEHIPVQPLYMSTRTLSIEAKAELLPRLSKTQRKVFLDIDLWNRDEISVNDFTQWIYIYSCASDELKYEFIKSPEFALFLKARFNIWTFDIEDPQYPDHDYYFLTECNQLLFEYDENCEFIDQIKEAIKLLYSQEGVENAYSYIFKIVADQIGMMSEDEYRLKKSLLQDYGFIDYFEALELINTFPTEKHLNNFIRKIINSKKPKVSLEEELRLQRTPYSLISPFENSDQGFQSEVDKISDLDRIDFLNFNFVKLINANIEINGGIKKEAIQITRTSKETKTCIELGLSYLQNFIELEYKIPYTIFEIFSFTEVFKIGKSLIQIRQKRIKNIFHQLQIDEAFDTFLGQYFDNFISSSLSRNYEFTNLAQKKLVINNMESFQRWSDQIEQLIEILPFAKAFKEKLGDFKTRNLIQDHFYLNYNVKDIDFPALLISSFANFYLNDSLDQFKMGLTLEEFKKFLKSYQLKLDDSDWQSRLDDFIIAFGFDKITNFKQVISVLLDDALDGYAEMKDLRDEEFKFIGGPIILNG